MLVTPVNFIGNKLWSFRHRAVTALSRAVAVLTAIVVARAGR